MRTVSFFRGTAEVLGVLGGGGVLSSLMMSDGLLRDFDLNFYLAGRCPRRQCHFSDRTNSQEFFQTVDDVAFQPAHKAEGEFVDVELVIQNEGSQVHRERQQAGFVGGV